MMNRGPMANGVALRSCWATQVVLGLRVTPTCTTFREPSSTMKSAKMGLNQMS